MSFAGRQMVTIRDTGMRNSAPVCDYVRLQETHGGLEKNTMDKTKSKASSEEQNPQSGHASTELDERYGKIGISAVAAAVCPKGERRSKSKDSRFVPYDSD